MTYATTSGLSHRTKAVLVGICILVAYGVLVAALTDSRPLIMISDMVSGLAVIGISLLMFPYLRPHGPAAAGSYLAGKLVEGILMIAAGIAIWLPGPNAESARDLIYSVHTYIFILSGFLLYLLLQRTTLIPRFISLWGMVAIICVLVPTLAEHMWGMENAVLTVFIAPIILNEVFLAIWLMVRGFHLDAVQKPK